MSSKKLFDVIDKLDICGKDGTMYFELSQIKTIISNNSVVGDVIQEWLKFFMNSQNIKFRVPNNTQEFPDFYMDENDDRVDLMEVKCFTVSPNFDIANFLSYCTSLTNSPYRLDSNYLIFEYSRLHNDKIRIKNIWLKKIWEICCPSDRTPIRLQIKKGQIYNIRPATWYSDKTTFKPFKTRLEFVNALKLVLDTHSSADNLRKNWITNIKHLYKEQTGNDL